MGRTTKSSLGEKNPNFRHGYANHEKRPSFYHSWRNMKERCFNKKNPNYYRYGGRGITVCEEWKSIDGFSKWALMSGWKEGLSIDRIDNDGNYTPENCRWISRSENSRKKRTTKISYSEAQEIRRMLKNGENYIQLANKYGVTSGTIWYIEKEITHVPDGECSKKIKKR
jgi:hypothetical protein